MRGAVYRDKVLVVGQRFFRLFPHIAVRLHGKDLAAAIQQLLGKYPRAGTGVRQYAPSGNVERFLHIREKSVGIAGTPLCVDLALTVKTIRVIRELFHGRTPCKVRFANIFIVNYTIPSYLLATLRPVLCPKQIRLFFVYTDPKSVLFLSQKQLAYYFLGKYSLILYHFGDTIFDFATPFLNNGISVQQLAKAMRLGSCLLPVVLRQEVQRYFQGSFI